MAESLLLKELLDFTRDGEWGKGESSDDLVEMAVIRGTDFLSVRRGDISTVPRRFIPRKAAERKVLMPGDILIETAGGTKDQPTGRTVYLSERIFEALPVPVTCASFSRFLRVKRKLVNPQYLFLYLQSIYSTGEMLPYHIQHTGVARFQYTDFASQWQVPLPPLEEQAEIADTLSIFDDKIELNRRMNETLEAMAQSIFKDWFVDFGPTRAKAEGRAPYLAPELWDLFPDALDDEDKPFGWSVRPASDLFEFNPRESVKKGANTPYLDMAALPRFGAVADAPMNRDYKSGSKFRNGDTLFARITPCLENGKTAYVFDLGNDVIGAGSTEFIVIRSRVLLPKPASYLLARDPEFRAHAERSMTGTSGRQRANYEALSQYELTAPADDRLWKALSDVVNPVMDRLIANAHESRTLAWTRDLLLPKLMSSEIRLREAERVVEAVA